MIKTLTMAAGAILLLAGMQTASAQGYRSCGRDAAEVRQECLRSGPPARFRAAECNRAYREDLYECRRYGRHW